MLKATASILALAAIGVPYAGFAQSPFALRPNDQDQLQIVSKIHQIQSRNGPFSAKLVDPWVSLSLSYQEHGDHDRAVLAIEKARHVVRVNYGLNTVREALLIWQEIRNQKAGGDVEGAWRLEQKLLKMVEGHVDDLGIVPILRGIADERVDMLSRYRAGKLPPQIPLDCYYDKAPSSTQCLDHDSVMRSLLADARTYYAKAIGLLGRHRRYSSSELRKLEASLIRVSYLDYTQTSHSWPWDIFGPMEAARAGAVADYRTGRQSYRRLITYGAATSAPWLVRVKTFVEMTDWDLLFSQGTSTLRSSAPVPVEYERAYAVLEHKDASKTSIESIFSPKIPIVIPTFLPNPLLSRHTPDSSGYIDVAFDITKHGRGKDIEILDTTTNAAPAARKELVHLIERCLFRPRITDGRVADTSHVVMRYYLNDQESVARACRYRRPSRDTHPIIGTQLIQ